MHPKWRIRLGAFAARRHSWLHAQEQLKVINGVTLRGLTD
jgi:hypothetical protein